jgi:phosphoglucosamine mutase
LLRKFGFNFIAINSNFDGLFPNRMPEPVEENLRETAKKVVSSGAKIGFCHDGDADRMVPIDEKGRVCDLDKFITFMAKKAVQESGIKKIVTTVDASMILDHELPGVEIVRTRVGDFAVAETLEKEGGCIGIEPAGAIIYPEFGLWPDGVYSIFKLLKFLEDEQKPLSQIMDEMKKFPFERAKIKCKEEDKNRIMKELEKQIPAEVKVSKIDGIRMEWPNSWILIRPSGTEPSIRITGEGKTNQDLKGMMDYWEHQVEKICLQ